MLRGLAAIAFGILAWFLPGISLAMLVLLFGAYALALLFYIAVWAIATGVLQIVAAIRLRKEIEGEWWLVFAGLASVIFGVLLMVSRARALSPCFG